MGSVFLSTTTVPPIVFGGERNGAGRRSRGRLQGLRSVLAAVARPAAALAHALVHGPAGVTRQDAAAEARRWREEAEELRRALATQVERTARSERLAALARASLCAAHDVNNLLGVVQGSGELLQQELSALGGTAGARAALIVAAAEQGAALTRQLLAAARDDQPPVPAPARLGMLLAEVRPLLEAALGVRGRLVLRSDSRDAAGGVDAAQFRSALMNLVLNARDALPASEGRVTIALGPVTIGHAQPGAPAPVPPLPTGKYVRVDVTDNGAGIPARLVGRVFDPFCTTKPPGSGTGLGLAQVREVARAAGGDVAVASAPGQGTTVSLFFPAAGGEPSGAAPATPDAASAHRSGSRVVLVVDDEAPLRETVRAILESAGYGVIEAADADQADAILASAHRVDALFADLMLPGGRTGADLAAGARRARPDLPVLLSSGYDLGKVEVGGASFDVLGKPFRRDALLRGLESILHS